MTTKVEPVHTGEFILSEASGSRSRENASAASGVFIAGEVVAFAAATKAVTKAATDGSDSNAVVYGAVDASSAAQQCVVVVRDAEVRKTSLKYASTTGANQTAANAVLAAAGIIVR